MVSSFAFACAFFCSAVNPPPVVTPVVLPKSVSGISKNLTLIGLLNLSKLAESVFAFAAALSAKSLTPSSPLFKISKPVLANLPTPGNFDKPVNNILSGIKVLFRIASPTSPIIGTIAAKAFNAAFDI